MMQEEDVLARAGQLPEHYISADVQGKRVLQGSASIVLGWRRCPEPALAASSAW